jgi:predicted PurR-regulated permease PerM
MDGLRRAGAKAWSIVGLVLAGTAITLMLIVLKPVVLALVGALFVSVALSPGVEWLARHRVKRGLAAALGTLVLVATAIGVTVLVVKGLASQWGQISAELDKAVDQLHDRLASAGVDGSLAESAQKSLDAHSQTLMSGILPTLSNLLGTTASIAIGVFVILFTTFFLLKDGPAMVRQAGPFVPLRGDLGPRWLAGVGRVLRGYIVGLTLLGAFNAVVVGLGVIILGVPLIGTIVIITLLGNYIPYLGAWIAGAFTVLIALASGGTETALIMIVVVTVANGSMQTLLQPFAYGASLQMSPLTTLLVTIVGGLLAGVLGVMLAAPITAIIQHTVRLLREPPVGVPSH